MAALDVASVVLLLVGAVPVLLTAIFTAEIVAAALRRPGTDAGAPLTDEGALAGGTEPPPPRLVVLVPAHNEETIIARTLADLSSGLPPGCRLLVVADNCSDATAAAARAAGVEVVERMDTQRRGKGYALEYGLRELAKSPPDVVVIMDADCRAEPGALEHIASKAAAIQRPVQALYEMHLPDNGRASGPGQRVAAFAWRVKTHLRPLGLARMGLPCSLMGTGMAFPFAVAREARVGTAEIVEDLVLGLELARDGKPPLFAPQARVHSTFPANEEGQASQRARWETGHMHTIARRLPGLVAIGITQRNVALLGMCADTAVPPLAFLVLMLLAFTMVAGIAWLSLGLLAPLIMAGVAVALLAVGLILAWLLAGRDLLSAADLRHLPGYVLGKMALYARILLGHKLEWVRTRRD